MTTKRKHFAVYHPKKCSLVLVLEQATAFDTLDVICPKIRHDAKDQSGDVIISCHVEI
ncbi:hypothetical protein SO02S_10360 [Salmonella enterica subsp. enterica serovar Oranienburg]|nr:hypothetical protein SO02S_10360 [Salmonella enterica subsp. enterica serovar Oranienburg]